MQTSATIPPPAWKTVSIWSPALGPGQTATVRVLVPDCEPGDPFVGYPPPTLPAGLVVEGIQGGSVGGWLDADHTLSLAFRNESDRHLPSRPSSWRLATLAPGQDSAEWDDED